MPFVHLSTPWLTGTARPRPALPAVPARCRRRPAAAPSAPRRRVTAAGISSWKPAFEAAVLNTPLTPPSSAPSPEGPPSAAPPAPTRGLTAERLRRLLRITMRLSIPFFRRDRSAKWHALACASLSVLGSALGAVFTVVIGNLFTALNERNVAAFWDGNIYVFALCVILFPLAACTSFTRATFVLRWQQFLTKSGLRMYFGGSNYYKLNGAQKREGEVGTEDGLDNPDEVIDQQFAEFASSMVDFTLTNLKTVVDVVLYSVILLRIFPPMYFVIVVIVAVGMLLVNRIGKKLFDLQALLLRRTADFRFALARVRMHAEAIAFYNGSEAERAISEGKLDGRAHAQLALSKTQFPMNLFINSFYFLPIVLPLLILGPLYFAGRIQLGELTKAEAAFSVLFNNLSLFIGDYDQYSWLGASIERLSGFIIKLEGNLDNSSHDFKLWENESESASASESAGEMKGAREVESEGARASTRGNGNGVASSGAGAGAWSGRIHTIEDATTSGISVRNLSVYTPCGTRRLIHDLSVEIRGGERVLIVGRSGSGKTSLLRCLAGLWSHGTGTIVRPARARMIFLPQHAYSPAGSLREQLWYPGRGAAGASPRALEAALTRVGLGELQAALGDDSAWERALSAGEMQRLAAARAVVREAAVVVVDEGTAGLDRDGERVVMQALRDIGCAVVSVGHRKSLVQDHDTVVVVGDGGEVRVVPACEFEMEKEGMC